MYTNDDYITLVHKIPDKKNVIHSEIFYLYIIYTLHLKWKID